MASKEELLRRAREWLEGDPDPNTRAEVAQMIERADPVELEEHFAQSLSFGTAGIRGLLGPGPNRMNRAVVARATAGLCTWLLEKRPDAANEGVCIGYDGRRMSREFAEETAWVARALGLNTKIFDRPVPTPLLAFSVLDENAALGVMITASHNPPEYNGYKVYGSNGAQLLPAYEAEVMKCISEVELRSLQSLATEGDAEGRGRRTTLGTATERRYLDGVHSLALAPSSQRDFTIVYTALHGVGEPFALAALRESGFDKVHSVAAQGAPDATFPTVKFPNPEEPGVLDLALSEAKQLGAELILANDPDADRLAVGIREKGGHYIVLTGNEIGCLLAHYLLSEGPRESNRFVVSSVVSSPMLGAIAEAHGVRWEQTLTGFKWIINRALEIEEKEGARFVFGYEEALGYAVGTLVRDKDGISSALLVTDMAAWCRSRGRTLMDELGECWRRYGLFLSDRWTETFSTAQALAQISRVMDNLRKAPPRELAGYKIVATEDLLSGKQSTFAQTDMLIFRLEGEHRIIVRPSGTEPKIKVYFDIRIDVHESESLNQANLRGNTLLFSLKAAFRSHLT